MDTNDFSIIPECGGLPDLTRFPVIVGVKQLKKALNKGVAHHVFLAENADPGLTEPIAVLCEDRGIPLTWVSRMSSLGQACGIEVGAAAAAILAKS